MAEDLLFEPNISVLDRARCHLLIAVSYCRAGDAVERAKEAVDLYKEAKKRQEQADVQEDHEDPYQEKYVFLSARCRWAYAHLVC